ncbi:MAG: hypothetical protein AMJ79_02015 [Phycisphaerae bacterium SM23_30]|nr:MAG: hypothetical protein AMJ79_02015 [Phycisphaerae bacterium SM23_30]
MGFALILMIWVWKPPAPKQWHTGRLIFEQLRDEYGYTGGIGRPYLQSVQDRLIRRCHIIECNGLSDRLKDAKRRQKKREKAN